MSKIFKWLLENLWQPITSFLSKILGNHLVQSLLSYFSFKLLETNQANQYLANVMLWFAVSAFILWILEKGFGVETPLIRITNLFKPFRNSSKFENPNKFEEGFEMTYEESVKLYNYLKKKGMVFHMKKLFQWLYANKVTVSGFLAGVLFLVEIIFEISTKLQWDKEWYYTAIAILYIIVEWAVLGRGLETIQKFMNLKSEKDKVKEDKKLQKDIEKAKAMKRLFDLANSQPQQPIVENTNQPQQPKTKAELEAMFAKARENGQ